MEFSFVGNPLFRQTIQVFKSFDQSASNAYYQRMSVSVATPRDRALAAALLAFSRRGRRRNPRCPRLDRRHLPGVSFQRLTIVSE